MSFTIYFDLETGGIESRHPNIQLAAIVVDDATLGAVDSFERKIQFDEADADPEALKLNHYSKDEWASAKPEGAVVGEFSNFCRPYLSIEMVSKRSGRPYKVGKLAGHNVAAFDLPRLRSMFGESFFPFSYHTKDTLQRAIWYFDEHPELPRPESLKLTALGKYFGLAVDGAHDALTDVRLAAAVASKFREPVAA